MFVCVCVFQCVIDFSGCCTNRNNKRLQHLILLNLLVRFPHQEPLNSGDDVSDEEDQELFDTENVVVCQYDKVSNDLFGERMWHNLHVFRFLLYPLYT